MEPPSSINADQGNLTGQISDDPLSYTFQPDTCLIVTRPVDEDGCGEVYAVCAYSAQAGLMYIGQGSSILS